MATEIERKFLVTGTNWRQHPGTKIFQGYLIREPRRTVRVRITDERGYLTVKGATHGFTRPEFEYEIPLSDAEQMLRLCDWPLIEKERRLIIYDGYTWEVDEFHGDNAGLVVAEIELKSAEEEFPKPPWLGREVTADARYFNSNLAINPFCSWGAQADA